MAWNPSPEVAAARDAARKLGSISGTEVRQIVVLYLTDAQIGVVSYGQDRRLCHRAKSLADEMYGAAMKHLEAMA